MASKANRLLSDLGETVRLGVVQVMTVQPNVKYQDLFLRLQRGAREARRGLWR